MTDNTNNYFKNKNILVTGGAGFIGQNLIERLRYLGANVRTTVHKKLPGDISTVSIITITDKIDYVTCDLLDMKDCKKVVKHMDMVFHCAANTSGAAVMTSSPLDHVTPNIIMNSQLLEASYHEQIDKFIFISSSAAYPYHSDYTVVSDRPIPVKEEHMFLSDPYYSYFGVGWMKRYTEKLCQLYNSYLSNPIKTVIVRPSNVYGRYDKFDPNKSHVMAATIRKVVERQNPIKIWGDGYDSRDFIDISDFIEGLLLASQRENGENEVFNIASGINYTVRDILKIALDIEGYNDANIIFDNDKSKSTIPKLSIDTTKAEKLLGFKAKTDIREGIKKTIDWYRENLKIL